MTPADPLGSIESWLKTISHDLGDLRQEVGRLQGGVAAVVARVDTLAANCDVQCRVADAAATSRASAGLPPTDAVAVTWTMLKYVVLACVGSVSTALAVAFWVLHLVGRL